MELSIIIPTFNRAALLKKTLESIIAQHVAGYSFEVIVIDNGSTDNTREISEAIGANFENFIYHFDAEPGQLTGRHKGTDLSAAPIISFIDDDVELNKDWVRSVVEIFAAYPDIAIIGGPCLPKYETAPPSWLDYFWEPAPHDGKMCLPLSLIDIKGELVEIDPLYIFGLNYNIRKSSLFRLGGFHPDCIPVAFQKYQGDGETGLSLKAKSQNLRAIFAASVSLHHQVRTERMTPEYFKNWYYYSGVCNSFTSIRKQHQLYGSEKKELPVNALFQRFSGRLQQKIERLLKKPDDRLPEEIRKMTKAFARSYEDGFLFHQTAFADDKSVNEWVLRKDYWDYHLPA